MESFKFESVLALQQKKNSIRLEYPAGWSSFYALQEIAFL